MSVEEFKEKAVEENGLFVLREHKVDEDGEGRECISLRGMVLVHRVFPSH